MKQYPDVKKILLIRLRSIGDLIVMTPCTRAVKETYPDCHLMVAVEKGFEDLFRSNPYVDELIVVDRKKKSILSQIRFLYQLYKKKTDMVINLHGGPRSCIMALFSGAKYRVGGLQKKHHFNWVFNIRVEPFHKVLKTNDPIHIVNRHLVTLKCAGIEGTDNKLVLHVACEDVAFIDTLLKSQNYKNAFAAVHCSFSKTINTISATKMANFADKIVETLHLPILLTGGPTDQSFADEVAKAMHHPALNLAGKTTLGQLNALFTRAGLFLGLDSGPAHIAAASGTWVIALFGPTSVTTWHPWTKKRIIIRKEFNCPLCGPRECRFGKTTKCLEDIIPEDIINAIKGNDALMKDLLLDEPIQH